MEEMHRGKLFLAGEVRLGLDVLKKVQSNKELKYREECASRKKAAKNYAVLVVNAKAVIDMMETTGKLVKDLKNSELKALILPLRRKEKMPTVKKDMIECYIKWQTRPYLSLTADEFLIDNEQNHCDINEDLDVNDDVADEEEDYHEV